MKLWILEPRKGDSLWRYADDTAQAHVVRAETERDAREYACQRHGREGEDAWRDQSHSTCIELPADGEAGIVVTDYYEP